MSFQIKPDSVLYTSREPSVIWDNICWQRAIQEMEMCLFSCPWAIFLAGEILTKSVVLYLVILKTPIKQWLVPSFVQWSWIVLVARHYVAQWVSNELWHSGWLDTCCLATVLSLHRWRRDQTKVRCRRSSNGRFHLARYKASHLGQLCLLRPWPMSLNVCCLVVSLTSMANVSQCLLLSCVSYVHGQCLSMSAA